MVENCLTFQYKVNVFFNEKQEKLNIFLMQFDNDILVSKIKLLCEQKKISQRKLASMINMTDQGLIGMYKKNSMKVSTLYSIANILNVPITYFFEDTATKNQEVDRVFDVLKDIVKQKIG